MKLDKPRKMLGLSTLAFEMQCRMDNSCHHWIENPARTRTVRNPIRTLGRHTHSHGFYQSFISGNMGRTIWWPFGFHLADGSHGGSHISGLRCQHL